MGAAKYLDKLFKNKETSNSNLKQNTTSESFTNYSPTKSYNSNIDSYEIISNNNSSIQSRYFEKPVSNDLISVEPFISEGWQESTDSSKESKNKLKSLSDKINKTSNKTNKGNVEEGNVEEGNVEGVIEYVLSIVEYATGANLKGVTTHFKNFTGILVKENNIISTGFLFVLIAFVLFFINITM